MTANDLCIRDLGYFHLKDLQHIHDKKAYYISRIKSNTRIYQKNPNSCDCSSTNKRTTTKTITRSNCKRKKER
ncbi:transposase, partial [Bacillus pseudomycoides]|uniref:transposase n=1 Tax=Bacillus pseudomycoides TaxID=64104 RepID=UPI001C92FCDC